MNILKPIFLSLSFVSFCGFVASAVVHASTFSGHVLVGSDHLFNFQFGMFVVATPLLLKALFTQTAKATSSVFSHFFRVLTRREKYLLYALVAYCVVTAAIIIFAGGYKDGDSIPMNIGVRVFSSYWMMVYGALAVLYFSMSKLKTLLRRCECRNVCPTTDFFCGRCGKGLRSGT